ncbi:hypothetical protein AAVH_38344, partial [Aphelenchoides avenae]
IIVEGRLHYQDDGFLPALSRHPEMTSHPLDVHCENIPHPHEHSHQPSAPPLHARQQSQTTVQGGPQYQQQQQYSQSSGWKGQDRSSSHGTEDPSYHRRHEHYTDSSRRQEHDRSPSHKTQDPYFHPRQEQYSHSSISTKESTTGRDHHELAHHPVESHVSNVPHPFEPARYKGAQETSYHPREEQYSRSSTTTKKEATIAKDRSELPYHPVDGHISNVPHPFEYSHSTTTRREVIRTRKEEVFDE